MEMGSGPRVTRVLTRAEQGPTGKAPRFRGGFERTSGRMSWSTPLGSTSLAPTGPGVSKPAAAV